MTALRVVSEHQKLPHTEFRSWLKLLYSYYQPTPETDILRDKDKKRKLDCFPFGNQGVCRNSGEALYMAANTFTTDSPKTQNKEFIDTLFTHIQA